MKTTTKRTMFWLGYLSIMAISLGATATAVRAAEKAAGAAGKAATSSNDKAATDSNAEVDISDVQNQYWKSHDKEFEVIQNKQYTKAGRVEFTALGGIYQRVDFQDVKTAGGSLAYHFSEIWGIDLMAYKVFSSDSAVLKRFKETRNATIEFNTEKYYVGIGPIFTPIYAKFSFLGKKISHFDLYLTPNIGITKTNESRFTYGLAIGQKFWLNPSWNIRLEYRWMHYDDRIDTVEGITATRNGGPGFFEDSVNAQNLMLGISYLF